MQVVCKEWRRKTIQVLGRLDEEKKEIMFMCDTEVMVNKIHYHLEYMI